MGSVWRRRRDWRWGWAGRHIGRLAGIRARSTGARRLPHALQEDLVEGVADAGGGHVPAVVLAHLLADDPRRHGPRARPRMLCVKRGQEWLPDADPDVLAEQHRGRALPARRREVGREVRIPRLALRPGV